MLKTNKMPFSELFINKVAFSAVKAYNRGYSIGVGGVVIRESGLGFRQKGD